MKPQYAMALWLLCGAPPAARACDGLSADAAWVREAPPGAHMMAGYARLRNGAAEARTIEALGSPQFKTVEAHETVTVDGQRRMREIAPLTLPPGGVLDLVPGGKHFMLMGPVRPLGADDEIELQLDCGDAGRTTLRLPVRRAL